MHRINNAADVDPVLYNEVVRRLAENAPVLDINKTEEELSFKNHVYHPEAYRQYCNEKLAANEAQNNKFSPESDGRVSDFDMEFTRIRDSGTPSEPSSFSLSSVGAVSVPTIGNIQSPGTPTSPKTPPRNQQRKSANFTPSAMVRNKLKTNVANQIAASKTPRNVTNVHSTHRRNPFLPNAESTPIGPMRNRSRIVPPVIEASNGFEGLDLLELGSDTSEEVDRSKPKSNGTNAEMFVRPASPQQDNENERELSAAALRFHETETSIQNVVVPSTQEVIPETQESQEHDKNDASNESDDKTIVVPETQDSEGHDDNEGDPTLKEHDSNASDKAPVAGSSALASNNHIPKGNTPILNRSNIYSPASRVLVRQPIWNKTEPTPSKSSRLPVPVPKPGALEEPMHTVGKNNKENITVTVNVNMASPVAKSSNDVSNNAKTNQNDAQVSCQPNGADNLNGGGNMSDTNSLLTDDDESIELPNVSNKTPNRSLSNTSAKRRLFDAMKNIESRNNAEIDDRTHTIYNANSSLTYNSRSDVRNVSNRNSSRVRFASDRFDASKTIATSNSRNNDIGIDDRTHTINNATRDIFKPSTSAQIDDRTHTISNDPKNLSTRHSSRLRLNTDPFITHTLVNAQNSMPINSETFNQRPSMQNATYHVDQNRVDSIRHSFGVPQKNSTLRHSARRADEVTATQHYSHLVDGIEFPTLSIDGTYNADKNYDVGDTMDTDEAYQSSPRKRAVNLVAILTEDEHDVEQSVPRPSRNKSHTRTRISPSDEDDRGAGFDHCQHDKQHVSVVHNEHVERLSRSSPWNPIVKISMPKRLNQSQVASTSSQVPPTPSHAPSNSPRLPPKVSQQPPNQSQLPPNSPPVAPNLSQQVARNSTVRVSIVSPPLEFQDSDIICETSPKRGQQLVSLRVQAGRESLTQSILNEPPEKAMPRKRSKRSNPQLDVVEETLKKIHQKPRASRKSVTKTGRRLYSSENLEQSEGNDFADVDSNDAVDGDYVFKVPTSTAPRQSKSVATVQSDTVQQDNSTASTDRKLRRTNRSRTRGESSYLKFGLDESNILQNTTNENGIRRSNRKRQVQPSLRLEMYKEYFDKAAQAVEKQNTRKRSISNDSQRPAPKRARESPKERPPKSSKTTSSNEAHRTVAAKSNGKKAHSSSHVVSAPSNVQGLRWCDTYFYNNLCNMGVTEPISRNENDVDLEYLRCGRKRAEVTFADKIEYMNMNDGVQFGFYPSISERTRGYIRMMPLAIKPTITNSEDLQFVIIVGTMVITHDGDDCAVEGGAVIYIKKGVKYSIKNGSESLGIIMFKYLD